MRNLRLAIAGHPCAGKSTVSSYLHDMYDFEVVSSKFLVEEAAKEGIILKERADFDAFQKKYRQQRSATFMTDRLFEMSAERALNEGIRSRPDVDAHIARGGLILGLVCPLTERFRRRDKLNPKYPNTIGKFLAAEAVEYDNPDPFGSHTCYALSQAQITINTNRPTIDVYGDVDEIMATLEVQPNL